MHKPIYLIPCIWVYRIVKTILIIPFLFVKYVFLGITFTIISLSEGIWKLLKYIYKGFLFLIYLLIPAVRSNKAFAQKKTQRISRFRKDDIFFAETIEPVSTKARKLSFEELEKIQREERENIKKAAIEERRRKQELAKIKRAEELQKPIDIYSDKKVRIKGHGMGANLHKTWLSISDFPKRIADKLKNNSFAKNRRNKETMQKEALLIDFNSEDAEKSDTKLLYQYIAKDPEGNVVTGYFEAFSKVEVHSFLLSEGFEVYSIKTSWWIRFLHGGDSVNHTRFKTKDLIFFLTQLSTYIKAGIPLVESLRILSRQYKKKSYQKIFKSVIYDLTMGENFSDALLKQNVAFPRLLINMIKTAEMTGELPEVLDDMAEYYTESEQTRKQMITAMMYPSIVFIMSVAVITFILMFVIPQFVEIYESMDASKIPAFTKLVIAISAFLKSYIIWIFVGLVIFLAIFVYLYRNVKIFRTICQWFAMHLPFIGQTIIYNEVTMFTKTFSSLLSHNVFITESMEILNKITNNEIYKMLILDTITNLARGDKISAAFKDHWAFPIPAYEMLVTGEKTGELPEMMGKVSSYYQGLHKDSVTRIKTVIEPFITIFLTVIVGFIILAIIIPMFNMYQTVQSY